MPFQTVDQVVMSTVLAGLFAGLLRMAPVRPEHNVTVDFATVLVCSSYSTFF